MPGIGYAYCASASSTIPASITTAPSAVSRTRCASPKKSTPTAIAKRISTCLTASTYEERVSVYALPWLRVVSAAKRPSATNSFKWRGTAGKWRAAGRGGGGGLVGAAAREGGGRPRPAGAARGAPLLLCPHPAA